MTANKIIELIEQFCPKNLAYSWDNVGLLCGSDKKEVNKVFLTLDINLNTVIEAINNNCQMIISHHPIFFSPVKRIDFSTVEGKMIELLIKNDIAVYASHTNMDTAKNGINQYLAEKFKLNNIKVLEENDFDNKTGLGRYGTIENEVSLSQFSNTVKDILNVDALRVCGDLNKKIKTVAIASGSCSECIPTAIQKNADVIITSDIKYHEAIDNVLNGIAIIDPGHYSMEICVMDIFENILKDLNIQMCKSSNKDIFNFI